MEPHADPMMPAPDSTGRHPRAFRGQGRGASRGHGAYVPRDEELDGLRDGESEQGGDEGVVVEDGEVGESRGRRRGGAVVGSTPVPHGPSPWLLDGRRGPA